MNRPLKIDLYHLFEALPTAWPTQGATEHLERLRRPMSCGALIAREASCPILGAIASFRGIDLEEKTRPMQTIGPVISGTGAVWSARIAALYPMPVAAAEISDVQRLPPSLPSSTGRARRQQEFAAGRNCARHALAAFGWADFALARQADGSPLWPDGIAGSISHTDGLCGAVAARRDGLLALGLDLEKMVPIDDAMRREICTASERSWLGDLPAPVADCMSMVLFSAKEAFYKCQYAITGSWLDFQDVSLHIGKDGSIELARIPAHIDRCAFDGRFHIESTYVMTGFCASQR